MASSGSCASVRSRSKTRANATCRRRYLPRSGRGSAFQASAQTLSAAGTSSSGFTCARNVSIHSGRRRSSSRKPARPSLSARRRSDSGPVRVVKPSVEPARAISRACPAPTAKSGSRQSSSQAFPSGSVLVAIKAARRPGCSFARCSSQRPSNNRARVSASNAASFVGSRRAAGLKSYGAGSSGGLATRSAFAASALRGPVPPSTPPIPGAGSDFSPRGLKKSAKKPASSLGGAAPDPGAGVGAVAVAGGAGAFVATGRCSCFGRRARTPAATARTPSPVAPTQMRRRRDAGVASGAVMVAALLCRGRIL